MNLFSNAVIRIKNELNNNAESPEHDDPIEIDITGPQLQTLLEAEPKQINNPTNNERDQCTFENTESTSLIYTKEFKELKKSIKTITNRSTYKDLLKAQGIKKVVDAIEADKSNTEILQIIDNQQQHIIKNTGTGFYYFFNQRCNNNHQSRSHKLLDKIKDMLENPDKNIINSEKTKLIN